MSLHDDCRCYREDTRALVAIKSMPSEHTDAYKHLFCNEVEALLAVGRCQVPRVIKYIDQGHSAKGEKCLILQYAHLHSFAYPWVLAALTWGNRFSPFCDAG